MNGVRESTTTRSLFGRKFRPFWGQAPSGLIVNGLFRTLLYGALCWVVLRLALDSNFVADDGIAGTVADFRFVLIAIAVLLGLAVAYSAARVVFGVLGLLTTHRRDGLVVDMRQRHRGDFLPEVIQDIFTARRHRQVRTGDRFDDAPRHTRSVIVIENPEGTFSYNIRHKLSDDSLRGQWVRLSLAGANGYVRSITPIDPDSKVSP